MIQADDKATYKEIDEIKKLDDFNRAKRDELEKLQYELDLLEDERKNKVQNLIDENFLVINKASLFKFANDFYSKNKEKDKKVSSDEKLTTENYDYVAMCVKNAAFERDIVEKFNPVLVKVELYCLNDSVEFFYAIGNRVVTFSVPANYVIDLNPWTGQYVIGYQESDCVWNKFFHSYSEKEAREKLSEWVRKNCKAN
jgi:hypothetical protein